MSFPLCDLSMLAQPVGFEQTVTALRHRLLSPGATFDGRKKMEQCH
jgi:hypothetical protein